MPSMPWSVLLQLLLLATAAADVADPGCKDGILDKDGVACCEKRCGVCGGPSCSSDPGGAGDCCAGKIRATGRSCAHHDAPCIIGVGPPPPAPAPAPVPPTGPVTIAVAADTVIATVAPEYVSFNIDTSELSYLNFSKALTTLAGALAPAHLRVGGTQGDYQIYTFGSFADFDCANPPAPMTPYRCKTTSPDQWSALLDFAESANLTVLFGLNDLFMRPTKTKPEKKLCNEQTGCPQGNLSNAEALLRWTAAQRPRGPLWGFELGNELNNCLNGDAGAKTQADDFAALSQLVEEVWSGSAAAHKPMLIGPDTHSAAEYSDSGLQWFSTFVNESKARGDHVAGFTFHMYSMGNGKTLDAQKLDASFLNADKLDHAHEGALALTKIAVDQGVQGRLWAGETASANNGGQGGITDTYIDGFWYLDQLGTLAALNVTVFQRQVLTSKSGYPMVLGKSDGSLLPLPDYWIALLHKQIMGQQVLKVRSSSRAVRVYAHCTSEAGAYGGGQLALALINIAFAPARIPHPTIGQGGVPAGSAHTICILTAGAKLPGAPNALQSQETLLNGSPLRLPEGGGSLADHALSMCQTSNASELVMPPTSYGFVVYHDIKLASCAMSGRRIGSGGGGHR